MLFGTCGSKYVGVVFFFLTHFLGLVGGGGGGGGSGLASLVLHC